MKKFNLDAWWSANVDPNISPLDQIYKKIPEDALNAVITHYNIKNIIESDDMSCIDLSDIL